MLLTALLFNTLTGVVCASVLGFSPVAGAVGMNAVAAFMGMAPQSASILREGVYTEIWTGELVKVLRAGLEGTWLSGIPDQSSIVNNDVIHLVEVGVDPDVLINNKTYPIDVQALEDNRGLRTFLTLIERDCPRTGQCGDCLWFRVIGVRIVD